MTAGPNVVLVVFDTARADAFEPWGAPAGASPTVAQMAADGVAVERMYSPACWTVPSHVSLFSGLLPRSAGLNHIGGAGPAEFRAALEHHEHRLLPSVLRDAGWETRGVSANQWIHSMSGFDLGFDHFQNVPSDRTRAFDRSGLRSAGRWYLDALQARLDDGAARIEHLLTRWQAEPRSKPFFWFVNLVECHSPYLPPKPWCSQSPVGRLRTAREARQHLTFESIWMSSAGGFRVPDGALARMRAQYAAAIRQMDDWLARLLDRLSAAGVLDDTQVVLTSDHGENFGEGGFLGHAFSLDDRLIRVPFVSTGPLALDPGRPASLVDVPAMLGDELGIPHPWSPLEPPVPVAQFDAPGSDDNAERMWEAIERWGLGQEAADRMSTSFSCATDGDHKVLRATRGPGNEGSKDTDETVDLTRDPLELHPRALQPGAHPALVHALDAAEAAEVPPIRPRGSDGGGVSDAETARITEQLRLLGYL